MMSSSYSFHRPFPSGTSGAALLAQNEKPGRTLLQLIRSRDKLLGKKTSKKTTATTTKTAESSKVDVDGNGADTYGDGINENELIQVEDELLNQLSSLNESICRCGLFANDVGKATAFYNCAARSATVNAAAVATVDSNTDGTKKRKRRKGGGVGGSNNTGMGSLSASSFGIYLDSINAKDASHNYSMGGGEKKLDLDEGLILTAICKILGVHVGRKKKVTEEENECGAGEDSSNDADRTNGDDAFASHHYDYGFSISCTALNIISSLCDHAKDGMVVPSLIGNTTCASIEGDMIGSIGTHLLDALHENIVHWYRHYTNYKCQLSEEDAVLHALKGSFKACASVICLLETRLSRADRTMQNIEEIAWMVLNNLPSTSLANDYLTSGYTNDKSPIQDGVRNAATALIASLALAGNSEGMPPSKIWSQSVVDAILLLRWAIHDFFPIPNATSAVRGGGRGGEARQCQQQYPNLWKDHVTWMALAKDVTNHVGELVIGNETTSNHRSRALLSRIQCLTRYIHSLLRMEGYSLHRLPNNMPSLLMHLPLDSLLDVSEILLSFPLAAEAKHRSTKSRLRSTPVADGLLSPNSAMQIAPDVRLCGHGLLNIVVESCRGGSGVRGRARRIVGVAVATLQSSCSSVLVSVVDGTLRSGGGTGIGDGSSSRASKFGSWLRGTITLRIEAIRTFHVISISLGSGIMSSTGTAKSVSRALVLLGGCLLEQVQENGSDEHQQQASSGMTGLDDEWGTLSEKAKLVESASNALASCIAAFGGFIANYVRGALDSITQTCFSKLYSSGSSSILSYSHVKRAILQLGMNCMCVPWQDGGRSTLSNIVRTVSEMLRNDPDVSVASAALSTLCVVDAFATPRAPPMLVPIRGSIDESGSHGTSVTASTMIASMNDSKSEIMASKIAAEDRRVAKSERKPKIAKKDAVKSELNIQYNLNENTADPVSEIIRESVEYYTGVVLADTIVDINPDVSHRDVAISAVDALENNVAKQDERKTEQVAEVPMSESKMELPQSASNDNYDAMDPSQLAENSDDEASDESMADFPTIVYEGPDDEDRING